MKLNKIFRSLFSATGQNNFWLSLTTVMAIFLLLPVFGLNAASLSTYVGQFIFYVLFAPFVALFELEMIILPIIAQFNNFTKLPGIVDGWVILRDLSNMFFIVVLLFMAFATILKLQSYGYKELLKTLIIMAILINFSKTIAGFLIDIGQVVMLTFVAAIKDVAAGNLTSIFGVDNMVTIGQKNGETISAEGSQIVLAYLLGGVMMMLASIVLMAFIVMLVMRVVFLWVLVVLSPLAFLANTFPATKKYFSEWFGSLTKEIIVGPVLIFFLWLSLSILNSDGSGKDITSEFKATSYGSQENGDESFIGNDASIGFTEAGKWENVLKFIIAISMLIGSLKVTQSMGSKAMAYGSKAADKLKSGASKAYKFAGNRVWSGSTGEGGLSGGLQRAGSAIAVPTLRKMGDPSVVPGFLGGVMTRASARMEGAEDKRKQRKQSKIEDRYKDIRDERKEAVYASRGGNYSKRALDKFNIEEGNLKDMDEKQVKAMVERAKNLNDKETVKKIKAQSAHAHDRESIAGEFEEKGIAAAAKLNTNSLDGAGGSAVISVMTEKFEPEQIKKFLEGMTKPAADAWRAAIARSGLQGLGEDIKENVNDSDKDKKTKKDKKATILKTAPLSSEVYDAVLKSDAFSDVEKRQLAQKRAKNISKGELLGLNVKTPNKEELEGISQVLRNIDKDQLSLISQSGSEDLKKMTAEAQIAAGRTHMISGSPEFSQHISPDSIDINIKETMRVTGQPETQVRQDWAEKNAVFAHLAFIDPTNNTLNKSAFANFAKNLDIDQLSKIPKKYLQQIVDQLGDNLKEGLIKKGKIDGPKVEQKSPLDKFRERDNSGDFDK